MWHNYLLGSRKYDSQVLPNAFAAGGTCRWPAQQPHDLGEVAPTVRGELKKMNWITSKL